MLAIFSLLFESNVLRKQDTSLLEGIVVRKTIVLDSIEYRCEFWLSCILDHLLVVKRLVFVLTQLAEVHFQNSWRVKVKFLLLLTVVYYYVFDLSVGILSLDSECKKYHTKKHS